MGQSAKNMSQSPAGSLSSENKGKEEKVAKSDWDSQTEGSVPNMYTCIKYLIE